MIQLPNNYYHCYLGNGVDAVLVGYTGSMVADKVGVDRCAWYKSDRYYPEDKLVMVAGRWLFRDNAWTTLNFGQARRELEAAHGRLVARLGASA